MPDARAATLTFVFTDIEGSTRMLAALGDDRYEAALDAHRAILRDAFAAHGGSIVRLEGDGSFVAFGDPAEALAACVDAQVGLSRQEWPDGAGLRVRMGVHTGEASRTADDDFVGLAVHHAARVGEAANGGQIVVSQATVDATDALPEFCALADVGEFRLRDVPGGMRLFVVEHPDLVRDPRAPRATSSAVHNLPIVRTAFVGRSEDMKEITKLLALHPLVTITGAGGVGKTRIAIEAASVSVGAFADGAWLVELASLTEASLVAFRIATALGIGDDDRQVTERLVEHLRDKHLLLVIDNCEHVIDVAAEVVDTLLRSCERLTILATSREPLRVRGEVMMRLPSLDVPEQDDVALEELLDHDAARMFRDRALVADPSFVLDDTVASFVAHICRRLDGIPLALELAAAQLRTMSAAALATSLDDRFPALASGYRTDMPRQQTLRATIDWSHDLLSDDERTLFRRLSVFRGGATLDAIERVCGEGIDVVPLLSALVDRSLVAPADDRFTMLETIIAYAAERLDLAGEAERIADAHRDYFVELVRADDDALSLEEMNAISREMDNYRIALALRADEKMLQLAAKMTTVWYWRGPVAEGIRWLQTALAANPEPTAHRANALSGLSTLAGHAGRFDLAAEVTTETLAIRRSNNDTLGIADALYQQAQIALSQGVLAPARVALNEAIGFARSIPNAVLVAKCDYALAHVAMNDGRLDDAAEHAASARIGFDDVSENFTAATILIAGEIEAARGNLAAARELLEESLSMHAALEDRTSVAYVSWVLGSVEASEGAIDEGLERLREAVRDADDLQMAERPLVISSLGNVLHLSGDTDAGYDAIDRALEIVAESGLEWAEHYARGWRAEMLLRDGRYEEAASEACAAADAFEAMEQLPDTLRCLTTYGLALAELGQGAEAREVLSGVRSRAGELATDPRIDSLLLT